MLGIAALREYGGSFADGGGGDFPGFQGAVLVSNGIEGFSIRGVSLDIMTGEERYLGLMLNNHSRLGNYLQKWFISATVMSSIKRS